MEYFAGLEHLTYVETTAYRDNEVGLGIQLEARLEELRNESTEDCERVVSSRLSRILGGGFAVLAAVAMIVSLAIPLFRPDPYLYRSWWGHYEASGLPGNLILIGSFGGIALCLLSKLFIPTLVARYVQRTTMLSGDTFADLDRLRNLTLNEVLTTLGQRLERVSVLLPLVAASLLGPLTIHRLILFEMKSHDFAEWVGGSAIIVGHCHIALAIHAVIFANKLRSSTFPRLLGRTSGWSAYWLAVVLALIPSFFLLGIPVVLVAATGILFVPWMYRAAGSKVETERELLSGDR